MVHSLTSVLMLIYIIPIFVLFLRRSFCEVYSPSLKKCLKLNRSFQPEILQCFLIFANSDAGDSYSPYKTKSA